MVLGVVAPVRTQDLEGVKGGGVVGSGGVLALHKPDGGKAAEAELVDGVIGVGTVCEDIADINWVVTAGHILLDVLDIL